MRLLDWAAETGVIGQQRDSWVNMHPGGPRTVNIPWQSQQPHISVETLLDWATKADVQQWRDMVSEMPEMDCSKRSRPPNKWRDRLELGLKRLGQPALLDRHADLLPAIESVDEMHRAERDLQEPATTRGFHEALQTELELRKADEEDAEVPAKVSRSWLQLRLKDLKAPEAKHVCTEANVVSEADEKAYKQGLAQKLEQIGDLRLQMSWEDFAASI